MGTTEKFCLRWNDFESNISLAFREIREEKDFFDCTLSCGSRQIQAHKLILSACSPFFRSVLKQNVHQHPLLYLKGVKFTDLQAVLNFMYHGEVNIAQEELNSFLSVAEELQVKGLTQNDPPTNSTQRQQKAAQQEDSAKTKQPLVPRQSSATGQPVYQPDDDEVEEVPHLAPVKIEPQQAPFTQDTAVRSVGYHQERTVSEGIGMEVASYQEERYDDYGGYEGQGYHGEDGQHLIEHEFGQVESAAGQKGFSSLILKNGNVFTCAECGKEFNDQSNCRRHIKISHNYQVGELSCEYCQKTYKNNYSLKDHLRKTHGVYNNYNTV